MSKGTKPKSPISISGAIIMPYRYSAGTAGSRFFVALKDNKRIMGIRCPQCDRVYVPPRSSCLHCFERLSEWVELTGKGTLESYTVVYYSLPVHPVSPPFIFAVIKLDGADSGLTHILDEVEPGEVKIGMRVQAVFREKREGNILDIQYFKPI